MTAGYERILEASWALEDLRLRRGDVLIFLAITVAIAWLIDGTLFKAPDVVQLVVGLVLGLGNYRLVNRWLEARRRYRRYVG